MFEKIVLENGKYEVCYNPKTGELWVNRHGEKWRDCTGDNLIYVMFAELCKLKNLYDY